jgi:hypothetical protein
MIPPVTEITKCRLPTVHCWDADKSVYYKKKEEQPQADTLFFLVETENLWASDLLLCGLLIYK